MTSILQSMGKVVIPNLEMSAQVSIRMFKQKCYWSRNQLETCHWLAVKGVKVCHNQMYSELFSGFIFNETDDAWQSDKDSDPD